jgi:hypothetical protein
MGRWMVLPPSAYPEILARTSGDSFLSRGDVLLLRAELLPRQRSCVIDGESSNTYISLLALEALLRLSSLDGLNGGSGIRPTIFVVGSATMFKEVSQVGRVGRTSVVCIPTKCFRRAAAAAYSLSQTLHFIMVMFIGKTCCAKK